MGAMKGWAMAVEELDAAREHWEQCDDSRRQAVRLESEAWLRFQRAKWALEPFLPDGGKAPETREDAQGTPNGGEDVETCAACGKPVPEADWDGEGECVHPECEPAYRQARAEYEAECRAEAQLMFGEGRGSL